MVHADHVSTIALIILGILVTTTNAQEQRRLYTPILRVNCRRLGLWCSTSIVWPLVWNAIAHGCSPLGYIGFAWPYVVLVADLLTSCGGTACTTARPWLRLDASTVLSLSFALATLSGAHSSPTQARLFILPVILFLCVVMPASGSSASLTQRMQTDGLSPPQVEPVDVGASREERAALPVTIERIAVAWSIGLILSGVFYRRG